MRVSRFSRGSLETLPGELGEVDNFLSVYCKFILVSDWQKA